MMTKHPCGFWNHRKWGIIGVTVVIGGTLAMFISCATVQRVVLAPPSIPGAEYVGNETCGLCHEQLVRDFAMSAHARVTIPGDDERTQGQGCESCHGPGSLHVEEGGGYGVHIVNPRRDAEGCFRCHLVTKMQFNLQYHHPLEEHRLTCTDCHDPHRRDIHQPSGALVSRVNETCMQCHREQARPHVFQHEAMREGCVTCHNPHGSINDKLLTERDNNLCLKCHGQIAAPGLIEMGSQLHNTFLLRGTCWSAGCHPAVHGSDINSHLRY